MAMVPGTTEPMKWWCEMANPFWSVIIPTQCRRPAMLRQALNSVLCQHPGPDQMEILLQYNPTAPVEGGSEGPFGPLVSFRDNGKDLGCYGSVNAAIRRARGEWVHVLHDDDWVEPEFYATMRAGLDDLPPSYGAASCLYTNHDEGDRSTWTPTCFPRVSCDISRPLAEALTKNNPLNVPAVVIRRSAFEKVGPFREDLPFAADWEFYSRLLQVYDWWFVPANLANYRIHADQWWHEFVRNGTTAADLARVRQLASEYLEQRETHGYSGH